jgi:hypothetical protein
MRARAPVCGLGSDLLTATRCDLRGIADGCRERSPPPLHAFRARQVINRETGAHVTSFSPRATGGRRSFVVTAGAELWAASGLFSAGVRSTAGACPGHISVSLARGGDHTRGFVVSGEVRSVGEYSWRA